MMKIKPYLFFLLDSTTGNCLYVDSAGNIQSQSILAAGITTDVSLKHAPAGWMEATLGYSRNKKYFGFNRSYSDPLKMVKDAAFIVRSKFYQGRGIETKLTLLIFKYNQNPAAGEPTYKLYHKAPIDFPQKTDKVAEGFQCNLLEGGILQMLKTYENTVFQIPCDGSIPENIKVNMDGMYVQDTFNYQIIQSFILRGLNGGFNTFPSVFISNDGDNIGIIHQDPSYANVNVHSDIPAYVSGSQNFIFSAIRPTQVRIKGIINITPVGFTKASFGLSYYTNLSQAATSTTSTHAGSLLTQNAATGDDDFTVPLSGVAQPIYFDKTISLAGGECLFLSVFSNSVLSGAIQITGGSFTMTFPSIAATTAPWCITAYDLFKLLIKNINQSASTQFQTLNFGADSTLLQQKLNLVCTSGDALRASGDPNYQKFFNVVQHNPNYSNVNNTYSYGPTIKTSLSDFFTSFNAITNASLGKQTLTGEGETVFFERKGYVYNPSASTFDLGEVSDMEVTVDVEKLFTILKVGYPEQQYDQKAGKYEWNTTLEMASPVTCITSKTFEIVSRYRADPTGIERLRSNIDNTSTTRNNSDNSVFVINTDRTNSIYDYFEMAFTSAITDPTNANNTNLRLVQNNLFQNLTQNVARTGYFSVNNDPSIFVLSQNGLSSTMSLAIAIAGSLNGAPGETVTIKMFVNSTVVKTYVTTATAAATVINIADTYSKLWGTGDTIYFQVSTSSLATATISSININMNSGYFTALGVNIPVDSGTASKMIAMPTVTAPLVGGLPVVSYGFQYYFFNSTLANPHFTTTFSFSGKFTGTGTPAMVVSLYLNGLLHDGYVQNGTGAILAPFGSTFTFERDWFLGDVLFALGSSYGATDVQFQAMDLKVTSTQIQAYALKRVQYDYISGIPNLCGYVTTPITVVFPIIGPLLVNAPTAQPITTGPGAPYNIEELTPKRMLMAWGNYLRSVLWDQPDGIMTFSTLSKNQYLVTTSGAVNYTENADVPVGSMDSGLFTLNKASFKTKVPLTFDAIMRATVNAFVSWTYNGQFYYGFPEDMRQKSTLNEMQQWEALIA